MSIWKPDNHAKTYAEYIEEKRIKREECFERLQYNADQLRNELTPAELKLGYHLGHGQILGIKFYHQSIISKYIIDFYAPEIKLAIEVDGSQHYQHHQMIKDAERDHTLSQLGITICRYNNRQVMCELKSVLEDIYNTACRLQKYNRDQY